MSDIFKKKGKVLSVDLSRARIKIAYLNVAGQVVKVLAEEIRGLDENAEDWGGQVVALLKTFVKEHSVRSRRLLLTVSDPQAMNIKHVTLPVINEEEILQAAKWQLKEDTPFNIDESVIDWQIAKRYLGEDETEKMDVSFVIADGKMIQEYLSIVSRCNLDLICISTSPFNYIPVVQSQSEDAKIVAVIDIGEKHALLSIYSRQKLGFVRKLPFSREKLIGSLTETIVSDGKEVCLSSSDAEEVLRTHGIPMGDKASVMENIKTTHVISLMRPLLEVLVREVKFSLNYFRSKTDGKMPSAIHLVGEGVGVKNIDKYLEKEVGVAVEYNFSEDLFKVQAPDGKSLSLEEKNALMSALSITAGKTCVINLLPEELKRKKADFSKGVLLKLFSAIAWAVFVFSLVVLHVRIHDYQARVKNARVHWNELKEIQSLKDQIDSQKILIGRMNAHIVPGDVLLKTISHLIPDEILLVELSFLQAEHKLTLKGFAPGGEGASESVLMDFMQNLEDSFFFTEASLISSAAQGDKIRFEISCDVVD